MSIEIERLKNIIESALMAYGQPLSIERIKQLFAEEEQVGRQEIRDALRLLQEECVGRGVELVEVGSGYRYQAVKDNAQWVARLWEEKPPRYSRALLETLVLVAYRQPITRHEIEDIRGVSVSTHIMKTLQERDWVRVVGHKDVPGKPALYATTKAFLDYFNLKSLEELPSLMEIRDLDKIDSELLKQEQTGESVEVDMSEPAVSDDQISDEAEGQVDTVVATVSEGAGSEVPEAEQAESDIGMETTTAEAEPVENTAEEELVPEITGEQDLEATVEEALENVDSMDSMVQDEELGENNVETANVETAEVLAALESHMDSEVEIQQEEMADDIDTHTDEMLEEGITQLEPVVESDEQDEQSVTFSASINAHQLDGSDIDTDIVDSEDEDFQQRDDDFAQSIDSPESADNEYSVVEENVAEAEAEKVINDIRLDSSDYPAAINDDNSGYGEEDNDYSEEEAQSERLSAAESNT